MTSLNGVKPMPTKRLPKSLRKQLEASLESLTPRQAGKLFVLYLQDLDRKKQPPLTTFLNGFPQAEELRAAQLKKADQSPDQAKATAEFNGFLFLLNVALFSYLKFEEAIQELALTARPAMERVNFLLTLSRVNDVAKDASRMLGYQPRPLSVDRYQRLVNWAEAEGSDWLEDVAERWADVDLEGRWPALELTFQDRQRLAGKRLRFPYLEDEQTRRDWAAEQGEEAVLKQHFEGDRQRLEDWLIGGGLTNWDAYYAEFGQQKAQAVDRLTKACQSGQLEAFEAVTLEDGAYFALKVTDGRIPAWAALRRAWAGWLADRRYYVQSRPFTSLHWSGYAQPYVAVNAVYGPSELMEGEALANLAGAFLEECRQRPWGKKLPKVKGEDLADLASFLTAQPSPIDYIDGPDLGSVDWKVFAEDIGEDPATYTALLSRSMEAARQQLGIPEDVGLNVDLRDIQGSYYPAKDPDAMGLMALATADKLGDLRLDTPSFVYPEGHRSPFFGELKTPLQQAVADLGDVFAKLATLKQAFDQVGRVFFDGLPVLMPSQAKRLAEVEDTVTRFANMTEDLLEDLAFYPWLVDVDRLKLVRKEAAPAQAFLLVDGILEAAWNRVDLSRHEAVDLGDGPFNRFAYRDQQLTPDIEQHIDEAARKF